MSQGSLLGVVSDTMLFYQATASLTGPAAELRRRLEAGQFILYVSDEVLNEARDVLSRPSDFAGTGPFSGFLFGKIEYPLEERFRSR